MGTCVAPVPPGPSIRSWRPADQPGHRACRRAARWSGPGHRHDHQHREPGQGVLAAGARTGRGLGRGGATRGLGLPQQDATAAVILSPPSDGSALSGLLPFGVLASSTLDANTSAAAEAISRSGAARSAGEDHPGHLPGRWRGRHVVQLNNWGNSQAQLQMVARIPMTRRLLRESVARRSSPGWQATVRLSARTKRPFLRGTPVRIPFQVIGEPLDGGAQPPPAVPYGDPSRPVIDAALNQKPILSRGLLTLLVLLVAGVVGVVAFAVTRTETPFRTSTRGGAAQGRAPGGRGDAEQHLVAWDPVALAGALRPPAGRSGDQQRDQEQPAGRCPDRRPTSVGLPAEEESAPTHRTRAKTTGPPSDLVCAKTAVAPATPTPPPHRPRPTRRRRRTAPDSTPTPTRLRRHPPRHSAQVTPTPTRS